MGKRPRAVQLKKHPLRWQKLPVDIRRGLVQAEARVVRIHSDLARVSQVPVMPRVDILDVALVLSGAGGIVDGCMTVDTRTGEPMAKLSAPTALALDDTTIRGVLLHEFAHCFNVWRRVYVAKVSGKRALVLDGDPADDAWDRSMLERPEDWFCAADVAIFPYHCSAPDDDYPTVRSGIEWLRRGLPSEEAVHEFNASSILVPQEILAHVRRLEAALLSGP